MIETLLTVSLKYGNWSSFFVFAVSVNCEEGRLVSESVGWRQKFGFKIPDAISRLGNAFLFHAILLRATARISKCGPTIHMTML